MEEYRWLVDVTLPTWEEDAVPLVNEALEDVAEDIEEYCWLMDVTLGTLGEDVVPLVK